MSSDQFTDKVVLIVGGTSGIGEATAEAFIAEGAQVIVAGRSESNGRRVADRLGDACHFRACDVTDLESMTALVDAVVTMSGRLDHAFNNAGWEGAAKATAELTEGEWLKMIDVKLNGAWRAMRAELVQMSKQGAGTVVNMAGSWGLVGFPNYASYCAAAHGIMGVTKAAAMEYAGQGIRINAVCPGAVDAPMLDRMVGGSDEIKNSFGEQLAIGRICRADEVAKAVLYLSSDDASYVNGVGLPLDGGG